MLNRSKQLHKLLKLFKLKTANPTGPSNEMQLWANHGETAGSASSSKIMPVNGRHTKSTTAFFKEMHCKPCPMPKQSFISF